MSVSLETLALAKKYANTKSAEIEEELEGKLDISKQAEKTSAMTSPVGVDADGKLWAPAGSGGASDAEHVSYDSSVEYSDGTVGKGISSKQDKITANGVLQGDGNGGVSVKSVDASPIANSNNLVTSGGVKSALDNKVDVDAQAEKSSDMTQEIGIDADGKLWTKEAPDAYVVSDTEPTEHDALWIDPSDDSVPQGTSADFIDYDNSDSGLEAETVQDALDELAERGGASTAADVSYDNEDSGLEATDVQGAIDEVVSDIGNAVKVTEQTFTDAQKEQARTNIGAGNVTKVKVNGTEKAPNASGVVDIGTVVTDVSGKENTSNKITDITSVSTDTQYPSAKAVYKMFQNVCLVAVDSMNTEYGSVTDISGVYSAGTTLTAVATANEGYRFMKWINGYTRDTVSTEASYEFTVSGNTNLMAIFIDESIELVPWASGTDEQIRKIVEAATFGSISLSDVWAVGDTRTVHLSAMEATGVGESHEEQDAEFVIMDFVCDGFSAGWTKPNAIVGLKNGLVEKGYMNSSNTNSGGWRDCKRRAWCNSVFKNAVPSSFRSIFKEFTWQQGAGGGASSGLITTVDTFALPPEKAIFGSRSYSFADEAALYNHWKWYQTSSNRVKKNGASGSASNWWEASPFSGNSYHFCFVNGNGGAYNNYASNSYCLAPFGCI